MICLGQLFCSGVETTQFVNAAVHGDGQARGDSPGGAARVEVAQGGIGGEGGDQEGEGVKYGGQSVCDGEGNKCIQGTCEGLLDGCAPSHALREAEVEADAPETGAY